MHVNRDVNPYRAASTLMPTTGTAASLLQQN